MKEYHEASLAGVMSSVIDVTNRYDAEQVEVREATGEERRNLWNQKFRFWHDEDELQEYLRSGDYTKEEVEELRDGQLEDMSEVFTDRGGHIWKVVTIEGEVFYVLAQNIDGHGHLVVLEEKDAQD